MLHIYWSIIKRVALKLKNAVYGLEASVGVVLFLLALFNPHWSDVWNGFSVRWAWVPLGVVFVHLIIETIYEDFQAIRKRGTDTIETIDSRLQDMGARIREWDGRLSGADSRINKLGEASRESLSSIQAKVDNCETLFKQLEAPLLAVTRRIEQLEARFARLADQVPTVQGLQAVEVVRERLREQAAAGRHCQTGTQARSWILATQSLVGGTVPGMKHLVQCYPGVPDEQPMEAEMREHVEELIANLGVIASRVTPNNLQH